MNKKLLSILSLVLCVAFLVSGCSSTGKATNFNDLPSPDGKLIAHLSTTNIAMHALFGSAKPLAGDATLEKTVADFTAAAKAEGASKVRIVQSNKTALWFLFPPITFFVTPVITNVAGDAVA